MASELRKRGEKLRRTVLGDDYVDASLAAADDFSRPIQELLTDFAWGSIWARKGLTLQTRSMLNLAMLTALNRQHELRAHVRGALRNGLTPEQIREVLLHAAPYCGIPAVLDAFRVAGEATAQARKKSGSGKRSRTESRAARAR